MTDRPDRYRLESIKVLGLFVLLSLCVTFPLITKIRTFALGNLGDPLHIAWILSWDIHQLFLDPLHLFEANIFYPSRHVLAYSEHLIGDALLVFPLLLFPGFALLASNVVYLLTFALSGWGVYLLFRELTGEPAPAIIAGLIFAFSPYRLGRLGHLHVLSTQWMPFIFLFLHRFAKKPNWKDGLLAGFFFGLQGLSCNHYAVFLYPVILIWVGFFLIPQRGFWSWRNLAICAASIGLALMLLVPFYLPYFQLRHSLPNFTRYVGDAKYFSAHWISYIYTSHFNRIYGGLSRQIAHGPFGWWEIQLFPGIVGVVLAVVAMLKGVPLRARRLLWGYGAILGFAVMMTFGPRWYIPWREIDSPYRFFFNYLPGWNGIRVPARMHMISMLSLSVLAGLGYARMVRSLGRVPRTILFLLTGALILLESLSIPLPLVEVPAPGPVYHWIAAQPGKPVILELPMPVENEKRWEEAAYLYASIIHRKPLVNGYSSYFPPYYFSLCEKMQGFPDSSSLNELRRFGVKYVIWHSDQYETSRRQAVIEQLASTPSLSQVVRFGDDLVFAFTDSKGP